jgi:hypothetical protein
MLDALLHRASCNEAVQRLPWFKSLRHRDGQLWEIDLRDDLTFEYSLTFVSSQLQVSATSGCSTCSIIWNGLELMSRKSFPFDVSRPISLPRLDTNTSM